MRLGDLDTLEKRMNERLNFLRKAYGECVLDVLDTTFCSYGERKDGDGNGLH